MMRDGDYTVTQSTFRYEVVSEWFAGTAIVRFA
jgi:hypothetical protein